MPAGSTQVWLAPLGHGLDPAVLGTLASTLLVATTVVAGYALIAWRRARRSESTLRLEQLDLQRAFDALTACVWTEDREGRVVRANRATGELLGRPAESLVGEKAADLGLVIRAPEVTSDPPSRASRLVRREPRIELTDAGGVPRTLHAIRVPYHNVPRSGASELVFAIDVTERLRAERELLRERQLFTRGPCVVFRWVAQAGWPVEYVSANVKQVFGYDRDDWLSGRVRYASVVHAEDLDRVTSEVQQHSESGVTSFEQNYRIRRADGEVRELFDFTQVTRDAGGRITHYEGYVLDVTDARRSEQARRLSDARLRIAVEQHPTVLWSIDTELRFTSSRGGGLRSLGALPDENIGRSLFEYFGTEDRTSLPIAMHLRALAGESVSYEIDWRNRVFHSVLEPLRDEGEQITGVIGFALDITELKHSEESLRQSQQFLRCVLDGLREQIAILDDDGKLMATNSAWNAHWRGADPVGQDYPAACETIAPQPEKARQLRERVGRVLAGEADEQAVEIRRPGQRGEEQWYEVRARGFGDGPHRWVALVQTDITARKLAESVLMAARDQLQESVRSRTQELVEANRQLTDTRQRLEYLLSVTPAVLLTRRACGDFGISFVTGNVTAVLGEAAEVIVANSPRWAADIHPDDRERVLIDLAQLLAGGSRSVEYRRRHPDGEWRWLREELQLVCDGQGAPLELIGIGVDITEQRAAAQLLEQSQRLAALGTLAAGVAHEINNPIGAILAIAQNARRRCDEDPGAAGLAAALDKIVTNVRRCGQIARSMLQFARQERTEKWPCDLNEVTERAVASTSAYADEREVHILREFGPGPLAVVINPLAIEQVACNLLRNAIEASPRGEPVRIMTRAADPCVRLEVADRGRGIHTAQRRRIFEPFFTTRQAEGGTGLGLSIVHGIVQEHGGRIDLAGDDEYATRVVVTLPISQDVPERDECRAS